MLCRTPTASSDRRPAVPPARQAALLDLRQQPIGPRWWLVIARFDVHHHRPADASTTSSTLTVGNQRTRRTCAWASPPGALPNSTIYTRSGSRSRCTALWALHPADIRIAVFWTAVLGAGPSCRCSRRLHARPIWVKGMRRTTSLVIEEFTFIQSRVRRRFECDHGFLRIGRLVAHSRRTPSGRPQSVDRV